VIDTMPAIGLLFLLLAGTISVATVVGRYHYVIDGIAGAALAVAVWTVAKIAGV
jgi:membrane-associated phospholipid phosphatase